jgi:predicted MFS family arabinose efflux permease
MSPRAAIATVFTLNGFVLGTWGARIPAIQDRLHVGPGGLAVALAGLAAGALIAMPLAGRLSSRHGSRTVVRAALLALGLGLLLPAVAPSVALLTAATFALGLANGSLDVSMNAQGIEVERAMGRPVLSTVHAGFSFGGLLGAGAGALAAAAGVGAGPNFLAAGLLTVGVATVVVRHLIPDGPPPVGLAHADAPAPAAARTGRWRLRALAFCCLFAEGAAMDWSAVHLRSVGAGAAVAALAYAAFSVAMATGRLTGDRLNERWGPVTLARRGGLLATGAMAVSLATGVPIVSLLAYLALGAGLSVVIPLIFRAAAAGADAGPALAGVTTTGYLGLLSGPPAIGAVASATSVPTALLLVVVATTAVALGAGALRLPRVAAGATDVAHSPAPVRAA